MMRILRYLSILIVLPLLLLGCWTNGKPPSGISPTGDFASPLEVKLSLSSAPALNQTAELTCNGFSRFGVSDITFEVYLPEGLALVNGNLSWQGSLDENQRFELNATVKAVKTGNWTIEAFAKKLQPSPGFTLDRIGQLGKLCLSISEDSAVITECSFGLDNDNSGKCIPLTNPPERSTEPSDNLTTPLPVTGN